ncbi:peptidylprolyl isomerase FKBP-type [Coriobacterium glomerans PW2]|uniref:Peptidyl-prolyl cis-trans isomerase n=1 Tax=Coriobacterium glomerans (strain ATCC 49209 / DSM 20642 / JCM 10262 / PW2) TaxID=700015 RepID=F2N7I1_CORGP|nr:peptidylprolyl isomerase [Coriobacterium glomerans]AEB06797.1 peptidylprolyl isomerase FKBP-type [Coriobacterium glomerans PW2]
MSNEGKKVRAHYCGTLDDGTKFDSSYDRGEPIAFTCGAHQMIAGFDQAVAGMAQGEKKSVHIPAAEAYGERREDLIMRFPADQVPNREDLSVGDQLYLSSPEGRPVPATVTAIDDAFVTLDANHQLAGCDLNFDIELVEIEEK